jgi:hypothetical protein
VLPPVFAHDVSIDRKTGGQPDIEYNPGKALLLIALGPRFRRHWRAHAGPVPLSAARQTLHLRQARVTKVRSRLRAVRSPTKARGGSLAMPWGLCEINQLGVWVKLIGFTHACAKLPAAVRHPRSEPASVIWSFPHQIKLAVGSSCRSAMVTLIRIQDLWLAVPRQCLLERLDAE